MRGLAAPVFPSMYTCQECGADFDHKLRACEICGGAVRSNGTQSKYTQPAPAQQKATARANPSVQVREYRVAPQIEEPPSAPQLPPSQPRYLPPQEPKQQRPHNPYLPPSFPQGSADDYSNAAGRFGDVFGFLPAVAYLAIIVDLMTFWIGWTGIGWPALFLIAVVMGFLTWRMQMKIAGDDNETALLKAGMVTLLTAIPAPLTPILLLFVRKKS